MSEPWEKLKGESRQAFAAFVAYRDMGPSRSTAKVARQLGKSKALMDRWSSRWQWVKRAEAYDLELDRQARRAREAEIRDMAERHAREAYALQQVAIDRLRRIRPEELSPRDVLSFLMEATKLERLSRGEPTDVTTSAALPPAIVEVTLHEE